MVIKSFVSPINSIATLPDEGGSFVSVGEDRMLRIWKGVSHTNTELFY